MFSSIISILIIFCFICNHVPVVNYFIWFESFRSTKWWLWGTVSWLWGNLLVARPLPTKFWPQLLEIFMTRYVVKSFVCIFIDKKRRRRNCIVSCIFIDKKKKMKLHCFWFCVLEFDSTYQRQIMGICNIIQIRCYLTHIYMYVSGSNIYFWLCWGNCIKHHLFNIIKENFPFL